MGRGETGQRKGGKIGKVQRAESKKKKVELRDRRKSCREEGLLEKKNRSLLKYGWHRRFLFHTLLPRL